MPRRRGWLVAVSAGVVVAALGWRLARARRLAPAPLRAMRVAAFAAEPGAWPGQGATLREPAASFGSGLVRVVIDPGHGAPNNHGNTSSFCVAEQDSMLSLAEAVADRFEATGHIVVRLTREAEPVAYATRLEEAASWGADAFVSLHSDVRGHLDRWSPSPGLDCPFAADAPGFAVLYADEGEAGLVARRLALGRAVARRMAEAGFLPYGGAGYVGLYEKDEVEEGLFVDRHAPEQRIFVLRRATMPSILVETHNALDPREATRWTEPETIDAFAAALAAALADVRVRGR